MNVERQLLRLQNLVEQLRKDIRIEREHPRASCYTDDVTDHLDKIDEIVADLLHEHERSTSKRVT